jgi:cytochrome c biogenesis protein CcmG, thiol:disulfide interchange protein DsbE
VILSQRARWKILPVLLAGLFISSGGCRKAPDAAPKPAASAPDFTLKDLEGRTFTLSRLKGQPVFLEFWATWCFPCQISMPAVEKIHEEYAPKGLQVLGLNVDEDPSPVPSFVKRMKVKYPTLPVGSSGVDGAYSVSGIPAFYLVDKDGRVADSWVGFDDSFPAQWRAAVERLLAKE